MQQHHESLRNIEHTARALARIRGACVDGADLRSAVDIIAQSFIELADIIVSDTEPDHSAGITLRPDTDSALATSHHAYCAVAIAGLHDPVFMPVKPKRNAHAHEFNQPESSAHQPNTSPGLSSQPAAIAWLAHKPTDSARSSTTSLPDLRVSTPTNSTQRSTSSTENAAGQITTGINRNTELSAVVDAAQRIASTKPNSPPNTSPSEATATASANHSAATPQMHRPQTRQAAQPISSDPTWTRCLTLGVIGGVPVGMAVRIAGLRLRSAESDLLDLVFRHVGEAVADGPMVGAVRRNALLEAIGKAQRKLVPYLLTDRTEQEIADAIGRSRHTVHDHVKLIYAAWGVNSRSAMCDVWNGQRKAPIHAGGVEIRSNVGKPTKLEH